MNRPAWVSRAFLAGVAGLLAATVSLAAPGPPPSLVDEGSFLPWPTAPLSQDPNRPLWFGFQVAGDPITVERLIGETTRAGVVPSLVGFYRQWPASTALDLDHFPLTSCDAIWAFGALPVVTWEPMVLSGTGTVAIPANEILGGVYDPFLRRWAQGARDWGKPLVIRFAHEMNLVDYHWGTSRENYGPATPQLYRRLWRHVVTIFRQEGATQVLWAFCPNHQPDPGPDAHDHRHWNTFEAWFPGKAWVDLIGVDGYNWGPTRTSSQHGWNSVWMSFADLFAHPVAELRRLAPGIPLVVWETGCAPTGGDRAAWLAEALAAAPRLGIEGILWFQIDKELAWALTASETAAIASRVPPPARPDWRPRHRRTGP